MAPRLLRSPRGLVALAAAVVAVCAVGFTALAQDWGSAAVGVLSLLVSSAFGIAALPAQTRARLLGLRNRDGGSLRDVLRDHATAQWSALAETVLPPSARAAVSATRGSGAQAAHQELATAAAVRDMFDASGGRMALIGEAGSGKTTTTIILFGELLSRAAADPQDKVPFFVRLSGWRPPSTLEEWLVDRLQVEVGLGRAEAHAALPLIVLLLDGLDEVAAIDREACGREIAQYIGARPGAQILLSCRVKEYRTSRLGGDAALAAYALQPLTVETLRAFLSAADPSRWEPVLAALTEPSGRVLAGALSSPLMASVVRDTFRGARNPADLVAATVGRDLDEAAARGRLWDEWLRRAEPALSPGDRAAAIGLARAVEVSGASEIRLERLGLRPTRWIWFVMKGAVAFVAGVGWLPGTVALPSAVVVAAFVPNLVDAAGELFARWPPRIARIAGRTTLVAAFLGALAAPLVAPPNALACGGLTVACVVVAARSRVESVAPWRLRRLRMTPLLTALVAATLAAALVGVVVLLAVVLLRGLRPGSPVRPLVGTALVAALGMASGAGLDFLGQHVLARLWHRLFRGVGVGALLRSLDRAGWVRRTSDSHRFLHLQLQRHLASLPSPVRVSFDNVGIEAIWDGARDASTRGDHLLAADLWRRVTRARPRDGQALGHLADALGHSTSRAEREEALKVAARACDLERDNADSWIRMAEALLGLRCPRQALGAADKAIRLNGEWSGYHRTRAYVLLQLNRPDEARRSAEQACALNNRDAAAWNALAEALNALARPDDALEASDRAVELRGGVADYQTSRAFILLRLGRVDEASAGAERARQLDPQSANAWLARSEAWAAAGRADDALRAVDRAVELDPEWPGYHRHRASVLLSLERWQEALAAADRVLELDDKNVNGWTARRDALQELERWTDALDAAERVCALVPDDAEAWNTQAGVLWQLSRLDDCLRAEDTAVELNDGVPGYHVNRASVLLRLDRAGEAVEAAARACALDPRDSDAWQGRASALGASGRWDEALATVDDAVAADPEWSNHHVVRSWLLLVRGRPEEGSAAAERAVDLDPDSVRARLARAGALLALRRFDDALGAVDQAVARADDLPNGHLVRAHVLLRVNRRDEAGAAVEQAAALDGTTNEYVWATQAEVLRVRGRLDEALATAGRAVERYPGWAYHHVVRARVLLRLGRAAEALVDAERAVAANDADADAHSVHAAALTLLERYDEALAASDRAVGLDRDGPDHLVVRALLLLRRGEHDAALVAARRACDGDPGNVEAWNARAVVLAACGRFAEALEASDRALDRVADDGPSCATRAEVLLGLHRFDEARTFAERACALAPSGAQERATRAAVDRATAVVGVR